LKLKFTTTIVTARILDRMKSRMEDIGFGRYRRFFSPVSMPRQRNLALILGNILEADATVILQEGCLIEDRAWLKKLEAILSLDGKSIGAVGIYGMQQDGGRLFNEATDWRDTGWPKDKLINQTLHQTGKAERGSDTPFVFGGKMVIMRSLAEDSCFDPFMRFGTDLDFLLTARLRGHRFTLDRLLTTKAPEPAERQRWRRYRQDIYRFIHMRYKLTHQRQLRATREDLSLEDFNPYPGAFLRYSIYLRAALVNASCFLGNLLRLRPKAFRYLTNASVIPWRARLGLRKRFKQYLVTLQDWSSLVKIVKEDRKVLRDIIDSK